MKRKINTRKIFNFFFSREKEIEGCFRESNFRDESCYAYQGLILRKTKIELNLRVDI